MEQTVKFQLSGREIKKAENELALIEFGHELKRIRRAKKLTQKRLAEITGIDDTVISDLENGNYIPSLVIIRQLAEGLNVSPYELIAPYYGIPVTEFYVKNKQALDKIRDIIATLYHFEINAVPIPTLTPEQEQRLRLRATIEEEVDIIAANTPDVEDKDLRQGTNPSTTFKPEPNLK